MTLHPSPSCASDLGKDIQEHYRYVRALTDQVTVPNLLLAALPCRVLAPETADMLWEL
jgi:hypothetical protein